MADSITIQNNNIMPLVDDLRQIINQTRNRVAVNVNAELTLMYWHIGERINREVLGNERAEYGKQIVAQVARQLQEEFGAKGFDEKSIRRMMQFASLFPEFQIVATITMVSFCRGYSFKRRPSTGILPDVGSLRKMVYSSPCAMSPSRTPTSHSPCGSCKAQATPTRAAVGNRPVRCTLCFSPLWQTSTHTAIWKETAKSYR